MGIKQRKTMEQAKGQRAEREPPSVNALEGVKVSGVLEMIPPEYWRRLRRELNALDWESINAREARQDKRPNKRRRNLPRNRPRRSERNAAECS